MEDIDIVSISTGKDGTFDAHLIAMRKRPICSRIWVVREASRCLLSNSVIKTETEKVSDDGRRHGWFVELALVVEQSKLLASVL